MSIDRRAWVGRHDVRLAGIDPSAPLQVGNGELSATVDVTGLHTFPDAYPAPGRYGEPVGTLLGCQSQWAWHSTPVDPPYELDQTRRTYTSPHGPVRYVDLTGRTSTTAPDTATTAENWLRNNPHRLMLGLLGLTVQGQTPDLAELTAVDQRLDLWTGTVHSTFTLAGADLWVTTVVHPTRDTWAVRVRSTAPVQLTLRFPYGSEAWGNAADWDHPERHTSILRHDDDRWAVDRVLDGDLAGGHRVALTLDGELSVEQVGPHAVRIDAGREVDVALTHLRATATDPGETSFATCLAAATEHWPRFWTTGGAVELLAADPRAAEIERRTVLSTYLTAVNCAGSLPPQETGLMVNSWRGRFHLEMHWWHAAHFPVWGRPELLDASLSWYAKAQPLAEQTAGDQGLAGARWPKQVGPDGRESPSDIGPFLIWQQPHPIHLAELCYRASADESEQLATLHRWEEVVTSTAEFMASFASPRPGRVRARAAGHPGAGVVRGHPRRGARPDLRARLLAVGAAHRAGLAGAARPVPVRALARGR